MKITEIRVVIESDIFDMPGFYSIRVMIYPDGSSEIGLQKVYPIDHLRSLFDMIWEDIGKELKDKLGYENE